MENEVYGPCVVLDIQPVAYVFTFTVYGQWLVVPDVVDEQRDQLFGELERPVVVRAVGDEGGHSVRVVECPDEVVRRGFAGRIRAVRVVFCRFGEELLAVGSASAFVSVGFTVGFCVE